LLALALSLCFALLLALLRAVASRCFALLLFGRLCPGQAPFRRTPIAQLQFDLENRALPPSLQPLVNASDVCHGGIFLKLSEADLHVLLSGEAPAATALSSAFLRFGIDSMGYIVLEVPCRRGLAT
jgi:hypothetical protein